MAKILDCLLGLYSSRRSLVVPLCASLVLCGSAAARAESKITPHPGGFWKVHPPTNFKGEFGGEDPIGLAFSQHIPTDCSIVWKDGQKFYCFSTQMSSQFVQENPGNYLPQAAAFWAKEHAQPAADAKPAPSATASEAPKPTDGQPH